MFKFEQTITMTTKQYEENLNRRYNYGLQEGFKDGYKAGYEVAKRDLPVELQANINLLVNIIEKTACQIEVHEDEIDNIMLDKRGYNGEYGSYTLDMKKIVVRVSPIGYAITNLSSIVDDVRDVITQVKGE